MTSKYLRAKALKIACSEHTALSIVNPLTTFTAYILDIERIIEIPAVETMLNAISSSKMQLAILMAQNLKRPVDPNALTQLSVEVIPYGGYFKINVTENITVNEGVMLRQGWNINLQHSSGNALIGLLQRAYEQNHPEASSDQVSKVITNILVKF